MLSGHQSLRKKKLKTKHQSKHMKLRTIENVRRTASLLVEGGLLRVKISVLTLHHNVKKHHDV